MPNHVQSSWDVKGPIEDLNKMIDTLKGKNWNGEESIFTLQKIIPMPKDVIADSKNKDDPNKRDRWYHWSIENWGSKWEPYSVSIYKRIPNNSLRLIKDLAGHKPPNARVFIIFQTAWSPITPAIEKLSEMFPILHFTYAFEDDGGGFSVVQKYKGGEQLEEKEMGKFSSKDPVYRLVKSKLKLPNCFCDNDLVSEEE